MTLGDGIRRNIASVDPTERALLRDAMLELNRRLFPGSRTDTPAPGGVSWWFKQDEIHQATHVHDGPEFLPWHREVVNRYEELLRQVNPLLSLHYWDWTQDPTNIPDANLGGGLTGNLNLFTTDFMGYGGSTPQPIGLPWSADGFYDPGASPARDDVGGTPADPPASVNRSVVGSPLAGSRETNAAHTGILDALDYHDMRVLLESAHDDMHGYVRMGGQHISFRDPFVYLLHSNVDRLFARWQTDPAHPARLEPSTVYGSESNLDVMVGAVIQNVNHNVEPWSTGHSFDQFGVEHFTRPWYGPENQGFPHNYKHPSVIAPPCYDTNLSTFRIDEVENPFNAGTNRYQVIFNDVPEEETTWRAAVIRVYTCQNTTFRVKPGTEPGAPFGIAVGNATATSGAHPHLYQDVRIWFQYTAGALGTAPHTDGPVNTTIRCDETGEEFQFELRANTIHRPTVAVQMVLDQSGSMSDPAGTSGLIRLQVLKDAAKLFASLIQDNNGLGIVRFDQDAYPPNDPTYGGLPITRITSNADRTSAQNVIDAQGAYGATSVGDGLIMGHSQLTGLPAGSYNNAALLLLTDGLENQPQSISDAIGAGAVNNRTFAIGLGNEFQVNTAALNSIAGSTGGNLLLSGLLTSGTDDFFRVKKFFLQILAAVTNTSIVRDPTGYINSGTRIKIPFQLSEADINCRVILLTDYPVVSLAVETPDGNLIDESNAGSFGVTFQTDQNAKTASFNLPIAFQAQNIQAGTWNAILEIDKVLYKRILSELGDKNPEAARNLQTKGARYCLSVHTFSNLRMTATLTQNSYEPGANLTLRATLKEYNLAVDKRASVQASFEYPDSTLGVLPLNEIQPGLFEASMIATMPGIYRFNVLANGVTYKGALFTREQILNAAVFNGGDNPTPTPQTDPGAQNEQLCRFLKCLLENDSLRKYFSERGLELESLAKCVDVFCQG